MQSNPIWTKICVYMLKGIEELLEYRMYNEGTECGIHNTILDV